MKSYFAKYRCHYTKERQVYVQGHPALISEAGEWALDSAAGVVYVAMSERNGGRNPQGLLVAQRRCAAADDSTRA